MERLPTAYGLVRYGVAPDHPEVKNVQNEFDDMMMTHHNDDNNSATIGFFGNVKVGTDVSLEELRQRYDVVVLAYGCESDRSLSIPGKDLDGILTAREFVAWYNGHVDFEWVGPIVQKALATQPNETSNSNIVVIGHGNVAMDCARILAKTRDELDATDIATRALDVVAPQSSSSSTAATTQNSKRQIHVVGRRGHVQGAFTIKELRELTRLPNADFFIRLEELERSKSTPASQEELKGSRPKTRIDKLLMDQATKTSSSDDDANDKKNQVHLRLLMNPIRFESDDGSSLARVVCERTQLVGEEGQQNAKGTGEEEVFDAELALVSIGYKGVAIDGTEPWFDTSKGILTNTHGLVDPSTDELGGLFVSGWLKRGPSGIIGTNIPDAKDTVAMILKEMNENTGRTTTSTSSLSELLQERGVNVVNWTAYQKIDAAETDDESKRNVEQPREKVVSREELLRIALS